MNTTSEKSKSQLVVQVTKGNSTQDVEKSLVSTTEQEGLGNLEKVRDILFGAQSRDYDKRIVRLEERLRRESSELRNDLKMRFDALETYIKKEVESLTHRVKAEQGERVESMKELTRELKDLSKTLERKVNQFDDQTTKGHRELRQQILDQHKSLSNDIQQKHKSMTVALEKAVQELRGEKIDRASLAELFMETAMRLNDELKIPKQ